jgi:hypothetical protein
VRHQLESGATVAAADSCNPSMAALDPPLWGLLTAAGRCSYNLLVGLHFKLCDFDTR